MKKNFKRIAATIAAAALCTSTAMSTVMNVDAATTQKYSTYRTYFYYDKTATTSSSFHELQLEYFSFNGCKVVGPGSQSNARTNDANALYDFSWYTAGSGSQYGSLGYYDATWNYNSAPSRSGMICKIVSEAYNTTPHDLAWAIGDENNQNEDALIEYKYKVKDRSGNLIGGSQYNEYYTKYYEDTDKEVLTDNTMCVKTLTVLIGDINNNGVVNSTDRYYLNRYINNNGSIPNSTKKLNNKSYGYYAADMNGDGLINNDDLTIMDNYIAGTQRLKNCQYS